VHVLCVDDERGVLEGLSLHLARRYHVQTATSGAAALELIKNDSALAVIVSDMRMPTMDGATFLARARLLAPNAVRVLLTGQTDINSAISAVNDGQIFRFLTKPCAPQALLTAVASAIEQNRLITAEKVLLEQTLHGAVKSLSDALALTNPVAFGRATRITQLVGQLLDQLKVKERWQIELAAMLSQLGHIALPAETAHRLYFNQPLSIEEEKLVQQLPAVTERLVGNIPRLELVREILATYTKPHASTAAREHDEEQLVAIGAELLRVATDFDVLESQGSSVESALRTLLGRAGTYSKRALDSLAAVRTGPGDAPQVRELAPSELCEGMILAEDVTMASGIMLVARGHEVTLKLLERVRHLPKGTLREKLRVIIPPGKG
jgi:response regulator RpfG family c-di-GMP phosphodiesterase